MAAIVLLPSAFTDRASAMTNPLPAGIANAVRDMKVAEDAAYVCRRRLQLVWLLAAMLVYGPRYRLGVVGDSCRSIFKQLRENLMRTILIAMLMIVGVSLTATHDASAAAASGAPIANALTQFDNTLAEPVACRRVCDWRGCRTRCWGGPAYIARPPIVVAPVCRSVRVCNWRGCFWRRRC